LDWHYRNFFDNGLIEILLTDGGPTFRSQRFSKFCLIRGINHILSAPYHAQLNGSAERAVQTFKIFAKKIHIENPQIINVNFHKTMFAYLSALRKNPNVARG
jgi:transposase InsO family protein